MVAGIFLGKFYLRNWGESWFLGENKWIIGRKVSKRGKKLAFECRKFYFFPDHTKVISLPKYCFLPHFREYVCQAYSWFLSEETLDIIELKVPILLCRVEYFLEFQIKASKGKFFFSLFDTFTPKIISFPQFSVVLCNIVPCNILIL